jgi:hypothetical protein
VRRSAANVLRFSRGGNIVSPAAAGCKRLLAGRPTQPAKRRCSAPRSLAVPPAARVPERMIRVLGTGWPARVDKCVVQPLLNVVNNPLLEIRRIVCEHSNAGNGLFYRRFVSAANRLYKILRQQASDPVCVRLRDWTA